MNNQSRRLTLFQLPPFVNEVKHLHPSVQQYLESEGYTVAHHVRIEGGIIDFVGTKGKETLIVEAKINLAKGPYATIFQLDRYRQAYSPTAKLAVAGYTDDLSLKTFELFRQKQIAVIPLIIPLSTFADDCLHTIRSTFKMKVLEFQYSETASKSADDLAAEYIEMMMQYWLCFKCEFSSIWPIVNDDIYQSHIFLGVHHVTGQPLLKGNN